MGSTAGRLGALGPSRDVQAATSAGSICAGDDPIGRHGDCHGAVPPSNNRTLTSTTPITAPDSSSRRRAPRASQPCAPPRAAALR